MFRMIKVVAVMAVFSVVTGCSVTTFNRYDPQVAFHDDRVLVISKITLVPPLEQKVNPPLAIGVERSLKNEFMMFLSPTADVPLNPRKMIPMETAGASQMNISMKEFSFTPMPPGTHYIRYGGLDYDKVQIGTVYRGGAPVPQIAIRSVRILPDVEIQVPEGAKAVYVGTFVVEHDGKYSRKVTVKDEFDKALKALIAKKIPGITDRNVTKKLGRVVRQYENP